jgi:hypothetical protein
VGLDETLQHALGAAGGSIPSGFLFSLHSALLLLLRSSQNFPRTPVRSPLEVRLEEVS